MWMAAPTTAENLRKLLQHRFLQADPLDLFASTERLPEFSPVAAEGELDEANTIFVGMCSSWWCTHPTGILRGCSIVYHTCYRPQPWDVDVRAEQCTIMKSTVLVEFVVLGTCN